MVEVSQSDNAPGTYVLLLRAKMTGSVAVGRWGDLAVRPGVYLFVGSALGPGGLKARVSRHCREEKRRHWHVDYLRQQAGLEAVWFRRSDVRLEHRWAAALSAMPGLQPVRGFGCTDCDCESHLFFSDRFPEVTTFAGMVGQPVGVWRCVRGRVEAAG